MTLSNCIHLCIYITHNALHSTPTKLLYRQLAANGKGDADEVMRLLAAGALVNGERRAEAKFVTPLFSACKNGHEACVPILLDYGADPNKPSFPEVHNLC